MCGFIGVLGTPPSERLKGLARAAIAWRGQLAGEVDAPGFWMAAVRLPRTGDRAVRQPIRVRARDGGELIAGFNGEIYNAGALAASVQAAWPDAPSDGHAAVAALAASLDPGRFVGEYALAVYDVRRAHLTLSRDPLGCKPLFWGRAGGRTAFGSCPRAVSLALGLGGAPSTTRLSDMIWLGLCRDGSTFDGVVRVPPGGRVEVAPDQPPIETPPPPRAALLSGENLETALRHATERRLTPTSFIAWSGGIDSHLVASCAGDATPRYRLDEGEREGLDARNVHWAAPSADALAQTARDLATAAARPITSLTAPALAELARQARSAGAEVQLGGEGADEIFLGYAYHRRGVADEGHPALRAKLAFRDLLHDLLGGEPPAVDDEVLRATARSPRKRDWIAFDRDWRLPEHLLLLNSDAANLLQSVEARCPFADFGSMSFEASVLTEGVDASKPTLAELWRRRRLGSVPSKRPLVFDASRLGREWLVRSIDEVDADLWRGCLGVARPSGEGFATLVDALGKADQALRGLSMGLALGLGSMTGAMQAWRLQEPAPRHPTPDPTAPPAWLSSVGD